MKISKLLILFSAFLLASCAGFPNSIENPSDPNSKAEPETPPFVPAAVEQVEETGEGSELSGLIWHDMNRNGLQDIEESGMSAVTVFVQDAEGNFVQEVQTNSIGTYKFSLDVGTYQLGITLPDGYFLTLQDQGDDEGDSDPDQISALTKAFTITAEDQSIDLDAGLVLDTISYGPPASDYPDPTGPALEEFPFGFSPLTGLPVADPSLLNVPAMAISTSNFPVSARPQAGLSFSPMVFEIYIGEGMTRFMTIYYGEFPEVQTPILGDCQVNSDIMLYQGLILGNQVWHDENQNNIQDIGEQGIPGICVSLLDAETEKVIAQTTSNSNGHYGFDVEAEGQYMLQASLPFNFAFSEKDAGEDDHNDSDVYPISARTEIIQMGNENDFSRDIGMYQLEAPEPPQPEEQTEELGTIGDLVWLDLNQNGVQDEDEPGMAGVEVRLWHWNASMFIASTTTDIWGYYSFEGLTDDDLYRVDVLTPGGYAYTLPNQGEDDAKDSDVDYTGKTETQKIDLNGGADLSWDAGLVPIQELGPIRSGRLPYKYINKLFTGSCLVYAGKTKSLDIPSCVLVQDNEDKPEDINNNYFGFDDFKDVALGLWKPAIGINYSGNMFSYIPPEGGIPVAEFQMFYNTLNQIKWMDDPLSGGWLRFNDMADETGTFYPSTDRLNGKQLIYNNVVILFAEHDVLNAAGTVIDLPLSPGNFGRAWLFRDGMFFPIHWSTIGREWEIENNQIRPIKFVDAENNPVPLHPGNTWVHVVTPETCLTENPYSAICADPSTDLDLWAIRFFGP